MIKKKIVLHFSREIWDKPIVYRLIKDYDLVVNILKANVLPRQESYLVLELSGRKQIYDQGIKYLLDSGVKVRPIDQDIKRNPEVCTHCGACTAVCPTGALSLSRPSMEVIFNSERCSGCELCVSACPPRAMEVHFR